MLVICDYVTRYPEVIQLKEFIAPAIAEELMQVFSRHMTSKRNSYKPGYYFFIPITTEMVLL